MELTLEPHAQTPYGTPTFEVKARSPTRPFIKPIFVLHVDIVASVLLMPQLDFNAHLFGVLDDAPSSSVASWHSSVLAFTWPDGRHLRVVDLLVSM